MSVGCKTSSKFWNHLKNAFVRSSNDQWGKTIHERFRKEAESETFSQCKMCCCTEVWLAPAVREAYKEGLRKWEGDVWCTLCFTCTVWHVILRGIENGVKSNRSLPSFSVFCFENLLWNMLANVCIFQLAILAVKETCSCFICRCIYSVLDSQPIEVEALKNVCCTWACIMNNFFQKVFHL